MSDCRKCVDFEWCKEHEECGLFNQKQMTNADRIRSMTDEELAEWYWWMLRYVQGYTDSRVALRDWLRKEINDGESD